MRKGATEKKVSRTLAAFLESWAPWGSSGTLEKNRAVYCHKGQDQVPRGRCLSKPANSFLRAGWRCPLAFWHSTAHLIWHYRTELGRQNRLGGSKAGCVLYTIHQGPVSLDLACFPESLLSWVLWGQGQG